MERIHGSIKLSIQLPEGTTAKIQLAIQATNEDNFARIPLEYSVFDGVLSSTKINRSLPPPWDGGWFWSSWGRRSW
jgi:hypothetical protein